MPPPKSLPIFVISVFFIFTFFALAQSDRDADRPGLRKPRTENSRKVESAAGKKKRIREGTPFKGKRCIFRVVGTRVSMSSEDEAERYLCLENLNLERIMQTVEENPTQQIWSVDGMFTEYLGENYVLVQRAVIAR